MKVVLVEPEIPPNTGNIGRTCVAANVSLHLVGPLGFQLDDKMLKRAGLDYWPHLNYEVYENWEFWKGEHLIPGRTWFFSTKGKRSLDTVKFSSEDSLVFGSETKGLKDSLLKKYKERTVFIPMRGPVRSLNLANTVAIALYEAFRGKKRNFKAK